MMLIIVSLHPVYSSFKNYVFVNFREKKGERKSNNDQLPPLHPRLGTESATWVCALTGNRTSTLLVPGTPLDQLSQTSQGSTVLFKYKSQVPVYIQCEALEVRQGSLINLGYSLLLSFFPYV